jgi:hypothetical protein
MSNTILHDRAEERAAGAVKDRRSEARELATENHLPFPVEPSVHLVFPADLSALPSEEIGRQLTYWNAMRSRAGYLVAVFSGAALRESIEADQRFDVMYANSTDKHVTDKRHNSGALQSVRTIRLSAARLSADLDIMRALQQSYSNNYDAVSRELSRREREFRE